MDWTPSRAEGYHLRRDSQLSQVGTGRRRKKIPATAVSRVRRMTAAMDWVDQPSPAAVDAHSRVSN